MRDAQPSPGASRRTSGPEAIDDPPLTAEAASELMARFGFVAFRAPPDASMPDSCLMVILRDTPTFAHFDPEVAIIWAFEQGRGHLDQIGRAMRAPLSRPFSWGRIRLVDRLGKRNSFVAFGGQLTADPVGRDALLLIFRSPAPILRLPGHSQRADRLAEEVVSFFGRLVPRFWDSPTAEQLAGAAAPEALYAAFLLHGQARSARSSTARDTLDGGRSAVRRHLELLGRERPTDLAAGRRLLECLGLDHGVPGSSAGGGLRG